MMPEPITALAHFGVHTTDDNGDFVSVIAGGYLIVSTDETTTIKSNDNPTGVTFPRDMVELLTDMLGTHALSDEDDAEDDEYEDWDEEDDDESEKD